MNENNVTVSSVAIRYGFITGLVLVIFSLILFLTGLHENKFISWIGNLLLVAGIIIGIKNFKAANGGFMSFGQGLGLGTLLSGIAGVLSGIFLYVYMKFVDSSFLEKISEAQRLEMEERGMSDEQIDQAMAMSATFTSPGMMVVWSIVGYIFMGFIISLIVSAIMKNNRPDYELR